MINERNESNDKMTSCAPSKADWGMKLSQRLVKEVQLTQFYDKTNFEAGVFDEKEVSIESRPKEPSQMRTKREA